ncbi:MAG: RidA family protein [Acidobacteria bacterium]|nr:RidA family protein [Acidobacteriota bacterium]
MSLSRRRWTQIAGGAALAAAAACSKAQEEDDRVLIDHPKGNYRFVKGSGPYSSGAVAMEGYEIVHAVFNPIPNLATAFAFVEKHLAAAGRPIHALCGMELRIPTALSIDDFNAFNQPYIDKLKEWDLHVDGLNPVARTNVATAVDPVTEGSVYGFCYTVPSEGSAADTFVIAGAGELNEGGLAEDQIVARGDVSTAGLTKKADRVLAIMAERLAAMSLGWDAVTQSNVYSVHDIHPLMAGTILPKLGAGARHGIRWHYAAPPVLEIEYEMDLRGLRREETVKA